MKVVINRCYGGFGLSPRAYTRIFEIMGKECCLYTLGRNREYVYYTGDDKLGVLFPYDSPLMPHLGVANLTPEQKKQQSEWCHEHALPDLGYERAHPALVQAVEELGGGRGQWSVLTVVGCRDTRRHRLRDRGVRRHGNGAREAQGVGVINTKLTTDELQQIVDEAIEPRRVLAAKKSARRG